MRPCRTPKFTPYVILLPGSLSQSVLRTCQELLGPLTGREGLKSLFPHLLRLVPPGHGHGASLSLYFQVRAGTSSPFPRKGLVWTVLVSAGDAQVRSSQSVSRLHPCLLSLASPWSFAQELGRARSPSSPILSRPLSPPRAAGISPRCPRKGGGSHMALSHPPFPGNWAEESLLWPGGAPKAVPFPPGSHTPAVVPLQRLPHRARG